MDYDIARNVKIQGKTIGDCLESLRVYSEKCGVTYKATFGLNMKEFTVTPFRQPSNSKTDPIHVSFMWRHEYREYDNSL